MSPAVLCKRASACMPEWRAVGSQRRALLVYRNEIAACSPLAPWYSLSEGRQVWFSLACETLSTTPITVRLVYISNRTAQLDPVHASHGYYSAPRSQHALRQHLAAGGPPQPARRTTTATGGDLCTTAQPFTTFNAPGRGRSSCSRPHHAVRSPPASCLGYA